MSRSEKVENKMQIGCKSGQTRGTRRGTVERWQFPVYSTKREEATSLYRGLIVFGANRYPDPIEVQVLTLPWVATTPFPFILPFPLLCQLFVHALSLICKFNPVYQRYLQNVLFLLKVIHTPLTKYFNAYHRKVLWTCYMRYTRLERLTSWI